MIWILENSWCYLENDRKALGKVNDFTLKFVLKEKAENLNNTRLANIDKY